MVHAPIEAQVVVFGLVIEIIVIVLKIVLKIVLVIIIVLVFISERMKVRMSTRVATWHSRGAVEMPYKRASYMHGGSLRKARQVALCALPTCL